MNRRNQIRNEGQRLKRMNKAAVLLAAAILLAGISPAAAAGVYAASDNGAAGASVFAGTSDPDSTQENQMVMKELRLKKGSRTITINGVNETILRSPYTSGGSTMVPLGVFAAAFGAQTELGDGDTVRIVLGGKAVTVTIGSPVIWTSTGKIKAAAPAALVNGVLTVPLRPVAEGLGARLTWNRSGEITVRLAVPAGTQTEDEEGSGRVGNSSYGWSIDPAGQLEPETSEDESYTSFTSPTGSYYVQIHTLTNQPEQDTSSLLDNLAEDARTSESLILNESMGVSALGKVPYASVITLSPVSGGLEETRAYYHNGNVYLVYLASTDAVLYKDLEQYRDLLNSFEPSFNVAGQKGKTKDLAVSTDGSSLTYAYPESYSIALRLPNGWSQENDSAGFSGPGGQKLHFSVSSNPSGAVLDSWAKQREVALSQTFITGAYRVLGTEKVEISGEQGLLLHTEIKSSGGWSNYDEVLLIKDGFRYLITYRGKESAGESGQQNVQKGQPQSSTTPATVQPDTGAAASAQVSAEADTQADAQTGAGAAAGAATGVESSGPSSLVSSTLGAILDTVDIPFEDIEAYYGHVDDPLLETDFSKMTVKTSVPYGFTLQIPRYWTPLTDAMDPQTVVYQFPGGSFKLSAVKTDEPELKLGNLLAAYAAASGKAGFSLTGTENATFVGVPATIVSIRQTENGSAASKRVICFAHQGLFYTLTFTLQDTNATEAQKAALIRVEKSFAFLD